MKNYKKRIYFFLFVCLVLVIISFGFLFNNFQKQSKLQNDILKIELNLNQADSLTYNLLKIESEKRAFQLTRDFEYLDDIYILKEGSKRNIVKLKGNLIEENDKNIIAELDSLLKLRIENLDNGIQIFVTQGFEESVAFMQLGDKKATREMFAGKLSLFRNQLFQSLNTTTTALIKRNNNNKLDLLILLAMFIAGMFIAAGSIKKSQQKFIRNHKRFQEAQRIAKIGSWEWDITSDKVTWSKEQFQLFGEDPKTYKTSYEGYLSHLSEDDKLLTSELIIEALEGKKKYSIEHEIIRKDGAKIIVFEQGTVLFNENGKPTGMIGTTQDITEQKKAEEELESTKKKFQAIFDNAADGIYQSTVDGRFIMANPATARIFGFDTTEELISTVTNIAVQHYADPDDRIRMAELLSLYDHIENYEVPLLTKNKTIVWVSESTRIVRDENGEIKYFEGTLKDITERKRAEEELSHVQKKYQEIFNNTADGIYHSTVDGKFAMTNPSMARIFGYNSPEDLIESVTDIGTQIYANPADRKKMSEILKDYGEVENFEIQVLKKNKDIIWVSLNIRVVRDENDNVNYFEGTLEDITTRKMAEEQLLHLSNRLQLALKATSIGIWDWDIKNNQTIWDDEMLRLYNVDQSNKTPIVKIWEESIHPDDFIRINGEIEAALKGEKEYDTEFRIIWKDSSVRYVKGSAVVLRDEDGNPIRMIGTNKDITISKEAEEEILQLNKSLDQFANITAHDLQEPIRMVSGFLGLLEKKYADVLDEQAKSYIYRAKDGADRMSILIKDLLEFSRSGNKAAKKEPVDMAVVMDLVRKDLSIVVADTNSIINIPELLPVVTGTQSALYRLFLNLISNGIKFRKKDTAPEVTLNVQELPEFWSFTLQDNGIGVAEKDQPKLFQAFQRLHRRDEYPGTGLGLVTCKKIVETHGGKIGMTSEAGKGTAFHFTLSKALMAS